VATNFAVDYLRRHSTWRESVLDDTRLHAMENDAFIAQSQKMVGSPEMKTIAREHYVSFIVSFILHGITESNGAGTTVTSSNLTKLPQFQRFEFNLPDKYFAFCFRHSGRNGVSMQIRYCRYQYLFYSFYQLGFGVIKNFCQFDFFNHCLAKYFPVNDW